MGKYPIFIFIPFFSFLAVSGCSEKVENCEGEGKPLNPSDPVNSPIVECAETAGTVTNHLPDLPLVIPPEGVEAENGPFGSEKITGPVVPIRDYPWQVGLKISAAGKTWSCGGVLITKSVILTAAHCVDARKSTDFKRIGRINLDRIKVYFGKAQRWSGSPRVLDATWGLRFHKSWKAKSATPMAFDAALIRLAEPIAEAVPAPLQSQELSWTNEQPVQAVVSGWGRYKRGFGLSSLLRATRVPVVERRSCLPHMRAADRGYLNGTILCSLSNAMATACKGDSGGPLVRGSRTRPQTIGIVSWGGTSKCGGQSNNDRLVGGYTSSAAISDWVLSQGIPANSITDTEPGTLMEVYRAEEEDIR